MTATRSSTGVLDPFRVTWRLFGLFVGLVALMVAVACVVGAGAAQAAAAPAPAWSIRATSQPTSFAPGAAAKTAYPGYVVTAINAGAAPATAGATITDTVPAGLTVTRATGTDGSFFPCVISGQTVRCTLPRAVPPGRAVTVTIVVAVAPTLAGSVTNDVVVAGGGAASASTSTVTQISPVNADFDFLPGAAGLAGGMIEADGSVATQAGAHPYALTVNVTFPSAEIADKLALTDHVRDLRVELPPGIVVNPEATPVRCTETQLENDLSTEPNAGCPLASQIGVVNLGVLSAGFPLVGMAPLYNMVPPPGKPAEFGFDAVGVGVYVHLAGGVATGNGYGLTATANDILAKLPVWSAGVTLWGDPSDPSHDNQRGFCAQGLANGRCQVQSIPPTTTPLLTAPTSCPKGLVATASADSWGEPGNFVYASAPLTDLIGGPMAISGCSKLDFRPSISVTPELTSADSPTGLHVDLTVPQADGFNALATANLKQAVVRLPKGMVVNPAAASGLQGCSEAQIGLDNANDPACPDASKIGTVEVTTPLLAKQLTGGIYVAQQGNLPGNGSNPFGSLLAIYITAEADGALIKLAGNVEADPVTGQLTATFDDNPQLPFSEMQLDFFGGPRAALATPAACGTFQTASALTPWSGTPAVNLSSPMTINKGCAGLGWFGPFFSAGTVNPAAGASSPLVLRVNKPDGQSDLNGIALSLPEGLLGNLKGNIGRRVGTARVAAGVGPSPFWLSGPVVLEGPYGDAPFSLRVTVPAIAGPFNLGDVVVRQKIYVDSHDAHVTVVSDPLPTILQGIPVQLHDLAVDIDKAGFMKNPTNCAPKSIGGTLEAVTGQSAAVASRFQVGGCSDLPLAPKMKMDLIGKKEVKRGKHPTLSATLTQQPGESGLAKVKVRLPLSLALDPDNAEALCTPEQAAVKACPAASIVGHATAVTPLLDQPLKGDVFFVEGTRKSKTGRTVKTLPKLWVALRGQVAIDLWADSSISQGKYLVTTFPFVPDAPISSFKLDINGGQHGILAVTGASDANLCKQANVTQATYDGQNGKQVTDNIRMSSPCGFRVRSKTLTNTHAKVTLSGLGAGKLSISGKGIHKASRTIKHSDVATITPRLTEAGMRTAKRGKALRLRVTWNPKAKDAKTRHARATVKRAAKASSTRAHGSHRTR